jgi:hypothetical protein
MLSTALVFQQTTEWIFGVNHDDEDRLAAD